MEQRRWTVMVVPEGSGSTKSFEVSKTAFKAALYVGAVFLTATAVAAYVAVSKTVNLSHLENLERTNQLLAQELDRNEVLVATLTDTLALITQRNQRVRNLAGLENTDPGVLQAGIGGPEAPLSEDEAFLMSRNIGSRALGTTTNLEALLRRASVLSSSFQEAEESLTVYTSRLHRIPSIRPLSQELSWFTSGYARSRMHPLFHRDREHKGLDIAADANTPIIAPANGIVIDKGNAVGYGNYVKIDHGNGIVTTYAHNSRNEIRVGQRVSRGDVIALVGSTGWATGPHLHYEIEVNGENVDPKSYILPEHLEDVIVD